MIRTHHLINNIREGKKNYSKSKIKKKKKSELINQLSIHGRAKKNSRGQNHKTPYNPTDLSYNPRI